ncbi:Alpha/Beta hydrolase protein [Roridomyces roridus]|uniref:Alpha/Beta hydrolase protein n=1 Tax=Roridomyces roridus TaxID=1738132 RepID=A0AAD7CK91_9AGAR|nr:Alpha/Beta hydrolase protein [Roridomyces roridus]
MQLRRKQFEESVGEAAKRTYSPGLPKETEYRVKDYDVEVEDGVKIQVRTLVPASGQNRYPLLVWIHGGGWTTGNVEMDDYQLRAICVELQISIVNIEYRLAPEHPHPIGLNDCYAALKWAAKSQDLLSADLKKGFIIGGMSAGGNYAAVLAHRARDDTFFEDKKITGQVLQIPALVHPDAVPEKYKDRLLSFGEQNKFAPILARDEVMWYYKMLQGTPTDPEISPLLSPSHSGLPPAVIQICGLDPLRDEGLLYDKLLKEEGVKTRMTVYPGLPHAFNYVFPNLAVGWEKDYREGLRWILDGAPQ